MNFVKISFTLGKMDFNGFPGMTYESGRIRLIEYVTTRIYPYLSIHQHRLKHLQNRESGESQTVPEATDRQF